MRRRRYARRGIAAALTLTLVAAAVVVTGTAGPVGRTHLTGYFANSNGIFVGDEVRILGVPVGLIEKIEPEPGRAKITFWYDDKYQVPSDAKAVILSPALVSARAIQLTPSYRGGPAMKNGTVITQDRTAVPIEFDDLRQQLERLTDLLQPTSPGGVSTLGSLINTSADNLRGEGVNIRDTIIKMSQAFAALGDHSKDLFTTVKNISILVSALESSQDLLRQLNQNLAAVTGVLSNDPDEVGNAVSAVNDVVADVQSFVSENREALGTTTDRLASVSQALNDSLPDIKQALHVAAPAFQNFINIYQPAQATLSGMLAMNSFANPIGFVCGAVQAASRLGAEQSSKLCAQYLAPIVKNRRMNFPPLGQNLFVGSTARPNELTYSEDRLRPDYVPPQPNPPSAAPYPAAQPRLAAEAPAAEAAPSGGPVQTDPAMGLPGMMVPAGSGS